MAKIGNLSEWIPKEYPENPLISGQNREKLINKYVNSQKTLEIEIGKLKQELQEKNSKINQLSTEHEPEKASLLNKISLLCDKLQAQSSESFQVWIEEIELARLKARYNETTIHRLEEKLKNYKEKIIDLEGKLRILGVDPDDEVKSPADLNDFLKELFKITENLNFLAEKSEKNSKLIDSVLGNKKGYEEIERKRKEKNENHERNLKKVEKNDTFEVITKKIGEASNMIEEIDFFQNEISGNLNYLKDREIRDIYKILKSSVDLVGNVKRTLEHCAVPLEERKGFWRKDQGSDNECKSFKDLHWTLQNLEKGMRDIVIKDDFTEVFELQDVLRKTIETVRASEESLIDMSRICNKDYQSLQNEKSLILQTKTTTVLEDMDLIKKLLDLIQKQELQKQSILQPLKNQQENEIILIHLYLQKLESEKNLLKLLNPSLDPQVFTQAPSTLEGLIKSEHSLLHNLESSLHSNNLKSLSESLHIVLKQVHSISSSLKGLQSFIAPIDESISALISSLTSSLSQISQTDPASLTSLVHSSTVQVSEVLNLFLTCLPQSSPSNSDLHSVNSLMQESNMTVDILIKFYKKGEIYKKMVENTEIPEFLIQKERNLADKWQLMLDYLARVAEIGTLLEQVKRKVLEDELDLSQVKTTWQKQGKNLLRSERAIKRLVEVAPDQELVQDLGSKLSGISKARVKNLRNMRKNDSTGLTFQSNLDDLAASAEDLNEVLEKLADSLAGKEDLNEGEGNQDEDPVEGIKFRPLPIADDELVKELLNEIAKNLIFAEELAAGGKADEAELENIMQEAAGLAGAAKLVKKQAGHLRNLRDRIENFEENDRNKDKIIENIQSQQEKLINEIRMDMQKILDEKQKQQAQLDQLVEVHQKTLDKMKQKELESNSQTVGLNENNKKLNEALAKVSQEINEKDESIKKLEKEKSSESDRLNKEINKLSEDYANLSQTSALRLKELESKLKESESKLKETLEEPKTQISPELESVKSQLHQKFQQISDLELQIQDLKQALNSSSSELGLLTSENEKLNKIITELTIQLPRSQRKDSKDSKDSKSSSDSSENPSQQSSLKTYYSDILQNLFSKLSTILLKTDYVGDTLIEILPESKTKTRMDNLQEQFEEIVNHKTGQNDPESELFELLDVLDRYETVNGEQAARLAGASHLNAGEDMEKLAKSGKTGLSMKNKKNLRSGRPPVAPQNAFKNSLEGVKKTLNEILTASNLQIIPDKEEDVEESTYYENIEKRLNSFAQVYMKIIAMVREIEVEREKVVIEGVEVIGKKLDSDQVIKVLFEAYEKVKVKEEESIEVVLAHARVKIGIEKQVKQVLSELLEKDSGKVDLEKIMQGLSAAMKNSIETLKVFMNTEQINSVKSTAFEFELKPVSEMFDNFAARIAEHEKFKQDELVKLNNNEFWVNSLNTLKDLIGRFSTTTQELWTFYFKSVGRDSDKFFIRTLTPNLPAIEKENSVSVTSDIISIVSSLIQKNEEKAKEISQKQEEFFNLVSENEEIIDEVIRKILKDLQPGSDDKSKKELEKLKTDFEETSEKSYTSLYEKNNHIATALIQLGKFQTLLKKQGDDIRKQIKALESNLVSKTNELNSLTSEFEQEKKTFRDKIDLTESMLKDSKALNDKTNEDLVNKQQIIASLNNEKNDLNVKLDELTNYNSQFYDQVEELKKKLKLKERNLKEKSTEINQLEEKISELESRPAFASNPEEINDLKTELLRIKDQLLKSNNLIEQKEEDIKIVKRDKILLTLELNKVKENNKSLKEELGSVKAKIMMCENTVRELEEKNRLGVERNEDSISKVIMQAQELEKENEILKRQMKPALNYRRLYSGIVNENEINKSSAGHLKSKTRALKDKLNQNAEIIEKLQHENRMMERYKDEWLLMTQELESLKKKLEILETPEVKNKEFSTAMTKMNEMMKEFIKKDVLNEETKEKYLKQLNEQEEALKTVRMKNVFFKILMIGRIRSYYRLAQWRSATEIPEDVKYEDSDLVSLYTSIHGIILPSTCSALSTPHIEKNLQSAVINNPVKNQYKRFPIKCSSLPKFTLLKFFYSFLIEKAQADQQNDSNCKASPVPAAFLIHLKQQFGTAAESSHYLSEFLPALYYLYQEKIPLAVLICKLLKYQDQTPISTSDDPIVLQVLLLVEKLTKFDDNFEGREEELMTLGHISRSQGFDIIQHIFGANTKIGEVILAQFSDSSDQNIAGTDYLLNICEALIKVRSLRVDKVLEISQAEVLDKETFDKVVKNLKPEVDESHLEKYFLTAIKDSDIYLKASVNGMLEALDQAKVDFFSINKSPKKGEVESIEKILSSQKSMTSESEVAIHKKVIKKKVAKKNS